MEYLYTSNTFRFSGVTAYWCFQRLLPSQSLNLIQELRLQYSYSQAYDLVDGLILGIPPYGRDCWYETWETISKMKGLKHARADFFICVPYVHAEQEEIFFSPLKCLRDGVEVEVRANWEKHISVPEGMTWAFVVRRDMVYHEESDGFFTLDAE